MCIRDRGILVIEENRLTGVNKEHIDLLERMIVRDRNHPCVILWSVGNEEWGIEWEETGNRIVATMREYCHRIDPTRLMTVASSGGPTVLAPADVAGYNYIDVYKRQGCRYSTSPKLLSRVLSTRYRLSGRWEQVVVPCHYQLVVCPFR